MEYLYVCHFSNGHIKVGRGIDPEARIAQHRERVSCLGVDLVNSYFTPVSGAVVAAESALIDLCAKHATSRNLNEWFVGLDFEDACVLAARCALDAKHASADTSITDGAVNFKAIVRGLMAQGVTQAQIAQHCGCHQCTISDLANGKTTDPFYSMGVKLLALYESKASA